MLFFVCLLALTFDGFYRCFCIMANYANFHWNSSLEVYCILSQEVVYLRQIMHSVRRQ